MASSPELVVVLAVVAGIFLGSLTIVADFFEVRINKVVHPL
jgi:hypothetical protein